MRRWNVAAAALFVALLSRHPVLAAEQPTNAVPSSSSEELAAFVGRWKNAAIADPVIARLEVEARGSEATVHVWARCQPTNCDWGEAPARAYRRRGPLPRGVAVLSAVFPFPSGEGLVLLFPGARDRLHAEVLARFEESAEGRNFRSAEPLVREGALSLPADAVSPSPVPGGVAPVRVGGRVKEPAKLKDVKPVYPDEAKRDRIQGTVILECTIGTEGKVTDIKVLRGVPELIDAAVEAVKRWEYTPTTLDGVVVPVIMTVTVNFYLS
jgi:TonB family protein